ncbi:MAG: hypothetical protein PHS99_04055, partial [Candidatus Marinimicrobia bacterium]|nr:hypothetical protein [Candidatus Neomarinimicrobiota bacterium]
MISFKQARDVLNYSKEFHHQLDEYYKTLNNKTDKIRVKMLLDYLMDHEKKLEKNIERIEETIPP